MWRLLHPGAGSENNANTGHPRENIVVVSGIGCSSRFPYYMNTYGMHSIHGRATAIAKGLKSARPELSVWIVTGDGDSLSIGGNHTIHLLRRNFDVNVLLFNNQIYGLTKGQYSPTSEEHKVTKSTPFGSIDHPFNHWRWPWCRCQFIARSMDRDPKHLQSMFPAGAATQRIFVPRNISELQHLQWWGIWNIYRKATKADEVLFLEQGKPLIFGASQNKGIKLDGFKPVIVDLANGGSVDELWVHDEKDF